MKLLAILRPPPPTEISHLFIAADIDIDCTPQVLQPPGLSSLLSSRSVWVSQQALDGGMAMRHAITEQKGGRLLSQCRAVQTDDSLRHMLKSCFSLSRTFVSSSWMSNSLSPSSNALVSR
ncbi:unnamed protein product [Mycena citricolor]|uniref:Uncharacterized protein n=1 Tax=Mycena citricolor TaxID=2018698 RepID=A0AAD2K125_9AGAR|nr:unnamed protein product [Mycena citricolor]